MWKQNTEKVAAEHSSDWLIALPIPDMGLKLDNKGMETDCGLRLGTKLCQPFKCICGAIVDSTGRHGLSCPKAKGRCSRHLKVNQIIGKALGSAHMTATLEPEGLCKNSQKQPDGVTLISWKSGKSLTWDYTCHDTLANSYLHLSSQGAGKVAEKADKDKYTKLEKVTRFTGFCNGLTLPVYNTLRNQSFLNDKVNSGVESSAKVLSEQPFTTLQFD